MPYTLSARQARFYTELADIYELIPSADDVETYNLVASDVHCQFWPTNNFDTVEGGFRKKQTGIMTSDRIHFHSDETTITANIVIHIKAGSLRQADSWHKAQGAPDKHEFRSKHQEIYVVGVLPLEAGQIV
jgi:hypothetical protein